MKKRLRNAWKHLPFLPALVRWYRLTPQGDRGISRVGHRAYVGGLWEELGRLQFDFLVQEGLKPHHYLLDIGCGSFRAGVHFIPYLEAGHYLGIDKEEGLIRSGLEYELTPGLLAEKKPVILVSDCFAFERLHVRPDFALAHSVFTHLPSDRIHDCLGKLRIVIRDSGRFLATYFECERPVANPARPHDHARFEYTKDEMVAFGRKNGWEMEYVGPWNHPRGQVIVRYRPD